MFKAVVGAFLLATLIPCQGAGQGTTIDLWPDVVPGDKNPPGPEQDMTKPSDRPVAGLPVIRLGNVARPSITVFRPPEGKETGTAVLVCPGGGYHILALDLEGTEVCEWLNSLGVTAVLLKYRVPRRPELEKHLPPLQDAQRAISLLRSRAAEYGITTNRIGVIGFSAGGHLAAVLSTGPAERVYQALDAVDTFNFRPNFTMLVYPAYLTVKEKGDAIAPEFNLSSHTPPTFIAMTQDDPIRVETALFYGLALKQAKVPCELHVYPSGGHGYGLRASAERVTTWPSRAADWMRDLGLIPGASRTITFDEAQTNTLPNDWIVQNVGEGTAIWRVNEGDASSGKVLAQLGTPNPNRHFNLAIYQPFSARDVSLSVRLKALSGTNDQGGGLIWRYQDPANYYVVRANPLEDNVVLYKVDKGVRTDLPLVGRGRTYGAKVEALGNQWHTLKVIAVSEEFTVLLDEREIFRVRDRTFLGPGKIGLWTKSDAVTWFDSLAASELH